LERNKIYNGYFQINYNPGAGGTSDFEIISAARYIYLKAVTWQSVILNLTTGLKVTEEQLTELDINLKILRDGGEPLGNEFNSLTPPPSINNNQITLTKTGQFYFDKIEFINKIWFSLSGNNFSAANTYATWQYLTIETEEKIIY
jgi:hypothetical protein